MNERVVGNAADEARDELREWLRAQVSEIGLDELVAMVPRDDEASSEGEGRPSRSRRHE